MNECESSRHPNELLKVRLFPNLLPLTQHIYSTIHVIRLFTNFKVYDTFSKVARHTLLLYLLLVVVLQTLL